MLHLHVYYTASTSTQILSLHSAAGHCYKHLSSSFEVLGRCSQESNLSVPDHCILWKKKILFLCSFVVVVIRQKSIWSQEVKVPNSFWNFSAFAKWCADTEQRRTIWHTVGNIHSCGMHLCGCICVLWGYDASTVHTASQQACYAC